MTVFFFIWAVLELSFLSVLGINNLYLTIFITIKMYYAMHVLTTHGKSKNSLLIDFLILWYLKFDYFILLFVIWKGLIDAMSVFGVKSILLRDIVALGHWFANSLDICEYLTPRGDSHMLYWYWYWQWRSVRGGCYTPPSFRKMVG